VAHESTREGGFGGELIAEITENCFDFLRCAPLRMGSPRVPTPYSEPLENLCRVTAPDIVESIGKNWAQLTDSD
jgi:pyruvate dehydrogenase E1 component beta subunit